MTTIPTVDENSMQTLTHLLDALKRVRGDLVGEVERAEKYHKMAQKRLQLLDTRVSILTNLLSTFGLNYEVPEIPF